VPGTLGIHHVGLAVRDLDEAVARYATLVGGVVDHEAVVPEQGVHAIALRVGDGPIVELLAATGDDTPVGRFLAKRGEGMHHVAYEVRGIQAHLARLRAEGIQLIDEAPRSGLFGLQVAFIHPEAAFGCLIELVEPKEQQPHV
jgi:methylmalonyl-CoA/ethylmalonyl-CoA epimerase